METFKRAKNLYNALKEDEESIFFSSQKITKQLIKKTKKSRYEKDKVFLSLYNNIEDVNLQEEEVVIPTFVPFVDKKKILIDRHYIALVNLLNFYMQTLLT